MSNLYSGLASSLSLLALFMLWQPAAADVVTDWNLITVKATKTAGYNSNLGSRIEAIEAIAVYDAVNSIRQIGTPYHFYTPSAVKASAQAAAAQAAHDVLVNYFPGQKPRLDSALQSSLVLVNDGPAGPGKMVGAEAAADIIALRANDGADPNQMYPGPAKPGAGQYRPSPSGFAAGINLQWAKVRPFLLRSGTQFRPPSPLRVASVEYKKALALVESLGSLKSSTRTTGQTHIAQFYKQDAELTVNEAARALALSHHSPLEVNALAFVLADIAEADARIAIWDGKYNDLLWRPVTALNADTDGAVRNNYTRWMPLLETPPHPSYPCGHCGTETAGFEILKTFFGDTNTIELHTSTPGEPARTITSLSNREHENGWSRIYGGIHYPFENDEAQKLGKLVAQFALDNGPKKK